MEAEVVEEKTRGLRRISHCSKPLTCTHAPSASRPCAALASRHHSHQGSRVWQASRLSLRHSHPCLTQQPGPAQIPHSPLLHHRSPFWSLLLLPLFQNPLPTPISGAINGSQSAAPAKYHRRAYSRRCGRDGPCTQRYAFSDLAHSRHPPHPIHLRAFKPLLATTGEHIVNAHWHCIGRAAGERVAS